MNVVRYASKTSISSSKSHSIILTRFKFKQYAIHYTIIWDQCRVPYENEIDWGASYHKKSNSRMSVSHIQALKLKVKTEEHRCSIIGMELNGTFPFLICLPVYQMVKLHLTLQTTFFLTAR